MKQSIERKISSANNVLISTSLTLTLFWILNILKTANPTAKNFLAFYKPIGPLLGVYIISILSFFLFRIILNSTQKTKIKEGRYNQVLLFYIISVLLFALMVFPPIFEPIAHLLK